MDDTSPTPPSSLPDGLVAAMDGCSPSQLSALVRYAESLAAYREASRDATRAVDTNANETGSDTRVDDDATERPDGVPAKASTTVKEINSNRYYYWQWRDGDRIRSQYKGPVESGEES